MRRMEYASRAFIGAHMPATRKTTPNPARSPWWWSLNQRTTAGVSQAGLGGGWTRVTTKNSSPYRL